MYDGEGLRREAEYCLHNCPNIDDNYGPQVVFIGSRCPFCGVNYEECKSAQFSLSGSTRRK